LEIQNKIDDLIVYQLNGNKTPNIIIVSDSAIIEIENFFSVNVDFFNKKDEDKAKKRYYRGIRIIGSENLEKEDILIY
jgi:hypothetical protein